MADIILNRKVIQSIMESEQIDVRYANFVDNAFLPVPLAIDVIEKEKKIGTKLPSEINNLIIHLPDCVNAIPLSQIGLYEALNDDDFSSKYLNRNGNPIEFATEACAYEYDGWWDRDDLLNSFQDLSWI